MHPLALEQEFTSRSGRLRAWGVGLLAVAGLLWVYAAWSVFTPYTDHHWDKGCTAPAFADRKDLYVDDGLPDGDRQDHLERCAASRDWPGPVSALVLSTPLGVGGALLFAVGATAVRLREHEEARARAGS